MDDYPEGKGQAQNTDGWYYPDHWATDFDGSNSYVWDYATLRRQRPAKLEPTTPQPLPRKPVRYNRTQHK